MSVALGPVLPLVTGLAATAAAVIAVSGWAALGSLMLRRIDRRDPIWLPSAIIIGAALNSAVLALLTRAGLVVVAVAIVTVLGLIAIVIRRAELGEALRSYLESIRRVDRRWIVALLVALVVAWLYALAPPREADAMRYHLAHLRQIISDGAWLPIADFHYALPFAWSLNFLPFELIGLPQAAQMTSLLLLVLASASLVRIAGERGRLKWALMLVALLATHPFIVRTFTSATADSYAVFVVFTTSVLLLRLDRFSRTDAILLGFVGWVGVGSRYQLIAWGLIVTATVAWTAVRQRRALEVLSAFGAGAVAALILASPFYIANAMTFGNPVWPLFAPGESASVSYASAIARRYLDALAPGISPDRLVEEIGALVSLKPAFPLAAAIIAVSTTALVAGRARRLAVAVLVFALAWLPSTWSVNYPRLALPMIGGALLVALELVRRDWRPPRALVGTVVLAAIAMEGATVFAGADFLRYAVTGDARRFHRYTWFYDVYDWVNRSTAPDSRFLVVVYSGHSYYLDRQYRRADPWLSAVVDWRRVTTGAQLDSVLAAGRYDGVVYQFRSWSRYAGGSELMGAMSDAIRSGYLAPDTVFQEKLYTSRLSRRYELSTVGVFSRRPVEARGVSPY